ncbi:MAG: translation initiation factor IF-5A [Methanobacteriota archaeon]
MSTTVQEVRELREGRYMVMDGEPCKILSITTSKPGKHGSAKARIDVVGIFDGSKRTFTGPVTEKVSVPLIDKRNAQVVSIQGDHAQLMDTETFENFDLDIPEEFKAEIQAGSDIQYIETMGRRKIMRL